MSKESTSNLIEKFCDDLRKLNLNEAARIVEDVAKEFLDVKAITPSSLEKLANLMNQEISDIVDLVEVRSEIMKLNIPYISACISEALKNTDPGSKELLKLRKLLETLINFYKYYSGIEEPKGVRP